MRTHTMPYGTAALTELAKLVAEAKHGDPLAPVTIVVRDNIAAITVRRALARGVGDRAGVVAIHVTTLSRLAEQIVAAAGASLPPVTSPLLTALWRRALIADPGHFAPVVEHSATVRALVRAHEELRRVDAYGLDTVAASGVLGADLVRLHRIITAHALNGRRDQSAILNDATELVRDGNAPTAPVIVHCPEDPSPIELTFLRALDEASDLTVLLGLTGEPAADDPLLEAFGIADDSERESPTATRILHTSDSDDEVRAIVRDVRGLLADGIPAHRVAVLHPVAVPYARLLHDHLAAAGIATNGPGVRALRDRAIADGFLALLALDPDDLRRVRFFDWLGRVPVRLGDGDAVVPRTRWKRLSREAGISGGDWAARLADHEARHQARLDADRDNPEVSTGSIAYRERSIAETQELAAFVSELRIRLAEGRAATGWAALGEWALGMFRRYLGRADAVSRLPEDEQRAATAIENTLGAVAELDGIGEPPTLVELIEVLEVDLDTRRPRVGRFGDGVFVGPIGSASSLDVDEVFVVGLSEDLYPGRHRIDPLLPDAVRVATEGALPTARDRLERQHRALLVAFAAGARVTASFPRGDLRRGAERLPLLVHHGPESTLFELAVHGRR